MDKKDIAEQAYKNGYNAGFERGVKVAVEKMRAYLPPRDCERYPMATVHHWQLDEVLRHFAEDK